MQHTYIPYYNPHDKFNESSITEVGEENFRKFVEKYDGKTEIDL